MNFTWLKKNLPAILIIFSVPLILVSIWFHEGLILGTAESMIPFYRLESFQQKTERSWTDFHLGSPATLTIASSPTWWLLAQIQHIGIPGFIIQAFIFWFMLILSGLGMYKLTQTFFPALNKNYFILSALFYWFNTLVLVNVWNRFLYNYIVFYSILPLLLFFYIKGLENRKYIYAVIVPLFLAFFSYALTAYVFNLLTFFLLAFTCIFLILIYFKRDFIFFSIKYNIVILIWFLFVNAWWILPTFQFVQAKDTASDLASFITPEGNLYTLNILSQKLGNLIDLTRLIHIAFYQGEGPAWAHSFVSFPLNIILFLTSSLIFIGIYVSRKLKWGIFLSSLFLTGIFLAKGNLPPFGDVFNFFFLKFSVVQVFRDPFEKFSFLLSLAAAPLFALGIWGLKEKIAKRFQPLLSLTVLIIIGVLAFPFVSGLVFTSITPPNSDYSIGFKVKVPEYYADANSWLESQGNNFRFISFPLGDDPLRNEGITYKWEKGYQGVEPSEILFSAPGITFNTTIPYYSQVVEKLEKSFFEQEDFYKLAELLNIRYFLVRNDVDINERRLRKPEAAEAVLGNGKEEVKKVAQFGELTFWENLKWKDKTVYAATNLVSVFPQPKITEVFLSQMDTSTVLTTPIDKVKDKESLNIIYPETATSYQKKQKCSQLVEDFENPKKYSVDISKQSGYELLLDDVNLSLEEASLAAGLKVSIDDQPLQSAGQFTGGNVISYGKVNLTVGKHEISIERPAASNLVSAPDNIIIKPSQGNSRALFKIENFNPYSRYLVNFDYVIKLGQKIVFYFQQNNDMVRKGNIVAECLNLNILDQGSNSGNSTNVSEIYTPRRSDEAGVLFSLSPGQDAEATIKNLSVKRLIEPQPVLVKKNADVFLEAPLVTYTKISPVKYSVHVKGARSSFILVLSELFNSGWEVRFDDDSAASAHFLANAYANGWLIDKTGDFNLTLEFAPQRLLDIGKIVSWISFLGGLIYITSMLLKKKGL